MLTLAAMLIAAEPAKPVYLQCTFPRNGAVTDFTADEANSSVTMSLAATGFTEKLPASFTPTEVRFQSDMVRFVISRTDLTVLRTIKMLNDTDSGTCKVLATPKRAF